MTQPQHLTRKLVLFHPSPLQVDALDALFKAVAPTIPYENVVVPALLDRAVREGLTPEIYSAVEETIRRIAKDNNTLVVCTCSTLGGYAEKAGRALGRNVMRLDRPMAERAVALGKNIGVAAALESTLEPTKALLEEIAATSHKTIGIKTLLCAGAWDYKQRGDDTGYIASIVQALENFTKDVDVIVLAQGSMAPTQSLCHHLGVPVLSSPQLAIERALRFMERAQ